MQPAAALQLINCTLTLPSRSEAPKPSRHTQRSEHSTPATARLEKLNADAGDLRSLLKAGKLSPAAVQAALDVIDRERTELTSTSSQAERKATPDVIRMLPDSARVYREAVRSLSATLTRPEERQEARALIAGLLSGTVKVRQEGEAVYARLEIGCRGSAGRRWKS